METDSVDKDYASQLVRTAPTEPDNALATFQIANGFQIEPVATEPLISDPVAIAFDEYGRLFVVEMRGYSEQADENLGVIRLLEDTDDDGYFDASTPYVKDLSWPTAVACYDGGILVGVAPDILFCKDTDGDGIADIRESLFTGFGRQNVQGLLNSFVWGLDNRLYGSSSSNGGEIRTAKHPSIPLVDLRRRDFVIDPISLKLSAISGGGQHGMSFDRWGNRFVSSNSNHIQWVEFEDKYLTNNPLRNAPRSARTIAEDGPAAEVFRTSPVEPWREIRTRLRVKGMVGGPIEGGGRAAGYFTGASGITIYRGDAFGHLLQDKTLAFVGDVGGNLVHVKQIIDDGLNKIARRIEAKHEFLTSTDNWFRPVQFANGPDGALYVIDMYREVIEHPHSLPPVIKKHLDLTSGRKRGRIYRIVPEDFTRAKRPLPGEMATEELVDMLSHANGWHRETAARLIIARYRHSLLDRSGGSSFPMVAITGQLESIANTESDVARIRKMYCLRTIGRLDSDTLMLGLRDADPHVRVHAIRIAESHDFRSDAARQEFRRLLRRLATDPDIRVRYQLALSLGQLKAADDRTQLLLMIARSDADDSKMRLAVLGSLGSNGSDRLAFLSELLTDDDVIDRPGPRVMTAEVLRQIGKDRAGFAAALRLFRSAPSPESTQFLGLLLQSTNRRGGKLVEYLARNGAEDGRRIVDRQIASARRVVLDSRATIANRVASVHRLGIAEFHEVSRLLSELLDTRQPRELRAAAVETIGTYQDVEAAKVLLRAIPHLSPRERGVAINLVCSRDSWALEFLSRLESGSIPPRTVPLLYRQRLLQHRDRSVNRRAKAVLGDNASRDQIVEQYQNVMEMAGDPDRGSKLFRKTCEVCHRLDGSGNRVGPDLQPLRNRGAAFMLSNILDPNREIDPRYESYILVTTDGQSLSGIVSSETARSITLHHADGRSSTIARDEIDQLQATGKSLMPEGFEREFDRQSLADLVAYLIRVREFQPTGN